MKPGPIPDDEILEGHRKMTMRGDEALNIADVEMLVTEDPERSGMPIWRTRVTLDDGDLERLAAGEPIWVSFWGGVVPFDVNLADPPEEAVPSPATPEGDTTDA
jgi:hypothetical protein